MAAISDVIQRFGTVGNTNNLLYMLCGGNPAPSEVTSCTRKVTRPTTIRAVAGHMHLLGRSIKVTVNPHVLGGVSVRIGHDLYDGTVRRRLNETRTALAGRK